MKLLQKIRIDIAANTGRLEASFLSILAKTFFHPTVRMLVLFRLAQSIRTVKGGFWPSEFLWNLSVIFSSCHISVDAQLAPGVVFPHPTGIVIGSGVTIANEVVIYQNVTIGLRSRASADLHRYPRIGQGVVIYAGACIVGDILIGERSVIGANAVVSKDVPADAIFSLTNFLAGR